MNGSDNVRGADNQQERLWICGWIAGFVEGECCFSVPLEEHQLRTSKRENFDKFVKVLRLMEERKHLTVSGLIEIAETAETTNHRKPSKFLRILRDHTPTISCDSW